MPSTREWHHSRCANANFQVTPFRAWFPALPFLCYWVCTLLLYHVGPIVQRPLKVATYVYVLISLSAFVVFYRHGLRPREIYSERKRRIVDERAMGILTLAAPLALIGALGLALDRMMTGSGSIEKTIYETEFVRQEVATSWLTTISVLPYSLALVALACYFYCKSSLTKVPWLIDAAIWGTLGLVGLNTFLSANRGNFFWILTYLAFYLFFARGVRPIQFVFHRSMRAWRWSILVGICVVVVYSAFIARYRNTVQALNSIAASAAVDGRYTLESLTESNEGVATLIHLSNYGTHQYQYVDAFLDYSEPIACRPAFLLGGRLLSQIRRLFPEYEPGAVRVAKSWLFDCGLSAFAWPSMFGWLLAMFGYCGAVLATCTLGFVLGSCARLYLLRHDLGALVFLLCLYAALNMSFNWIGGDFTHNAGYLFGLVLMVTRETRFSLVQRSRLAKQAV